MHLGKAYEKKNEAKSKDLRTRKRPVEKFRRKKVKGGDL